MSKRHTRRRQPDLEEQWRVDLEDRGLTDRDADKLFDQAEKLAQEATRLKGIEFRRYVAFIYQRALEARTQDDDE